MKIIWIVLWLALPLLVPAQVNFTSSNLPIILIDTDGQEIPDEPKIMAHMQVIDHGPGQLNHPTDLPNDYTGYIGIERRGKSSQGLSPKKPYSIETREANGSDRKFPLLGMPEESDWAFLAPYSDKTLLRDALMLQLAREIMPWASRTHFVELVLNGNYQGVYLVTEKIKRDANRVDIAKLKATDTIGTALTGGYIIDIDKVGSSFTDGWDSKYFNAAGTTRHTYYQYEYPKPEEIVPAQKQYIRQWMDEFETMAQSPTFSDSIIGYAHYIDVPSFVDFVLLNELAKNIDAYRISTFLWKDRDDRDPRLHAGPVWDFNIALGNADYCSGSDYHSWSIDFNRACPDDDRYVPFWWLKLWQDQHFRQLARSRWQSLRADLFTDARVLDRVDSMAVLLHSAQVRNFERWPNLHEYSWPNVFCCGTYDQHVGHLRSWLIDRMHWMDKTMDEPYAGEYGESDYFPPTVVPNPSHGAVTFQYYVHHNAAVVIQVYDQLGRQVGRLTDYPFFDGEHNLEWTYALASGTYFFCISVDGKAVTTQSFVVESE